MPEIYDFQKLQSAVQVYFDVLYECDLAKFDAVFHPRCVLGTVKAGADTVTSLAEYREIIAFRKSPMSLGQSREELLQAIISLSDDAALVQLQVRIHDKTYRDHLNFIRVVGEWRIFSKIFVQV